MKIISKFLKENKETVTKSEINKMVKDLIDMSWDIEVEDSTTVGDLARKTNEDMMTAIRPIKEKIETQLYQNRNISINLSNKEKEWLSDDSTTISQIIDDINSEVNKD